MYIYCIYIYVCIYIIMKWKIKRMCVKRVKVFTTLSTTFTNHELKPNSRLKF